MAYSKAIITFLFLTSIFQFYSNGRRLLKDVTPKNLYEGDILLTDSDLRVVDLSNRGDIDRKIFTNINHKRSADMQRAKLWPDRTIPYEISSNLDGDKEMILNAFEEFHKKSCVRFVPWTNQNNRIRFMKGSGCWTSVGRNYMTKGAQDIFIGGTCLTTGNIIHELMHSLGFYHEHSRWDRNQYIEILWENIAIDKSHNFNKYSQNLVDGLGVNYDYESIMHYDSKAFSMNGKDTVKVIKTNVTIGQRKQLSNLDIVKLNSLYHCHSQDSVLGWSSWSSYSPCSKDCFKKRQRFCFSTVAEHCPGVSEFGVATETVKCSDDECYAPVNGQWGRWSSWSNCDQDCGVGRKHRKRFCDDPMPQNNGEQCQGIARESTQCQTNDCKLSVDDCQFRDNSFCHWKTSSNPDYKWILIKGSTSSRDTGPVSDHTTGTDYYIYTEASSPAMPGSKAVLTSKEFQAGHQCRCISWAYHMYGGAVGYLNLYVQPVNGIRKKIWSKNGNQGNQWVTEQATLSNISTITYTVQFESIRGSTYSGDIALDDIYFKNGPCGVKPLGCFSDRSYNRQLPDMLANLRNDIDWDNLQKTVDHCACIAFEKGYKLFSVQFYGECWGSKDLVKYDSYGPGVCHEFGVVGGSWENFVYTFV